MGKEEAGREAEGREKGGAEKEEREVVGREDAHPGSPGFLTGSHEETTAGAGHRTQSLTC